MRTVAVLCAAKKTAYRDIPGLDVYDESRDARTFCGGMPVIAHPPCRRWSQFGINMTKARQLGRTEVEREKELGIWCAEQVKQWGGILEQPAKSGLWEAAKLPKPGWTATADLWSMEVWQAWWGYKTKKATWLLFSMINPHSVTPPLRLHSRGKDGRNFELMSGSMLRSHTVPALAQWLVNLARTANV